MTSPDNSPPFDSDATKAQLIGTWSYSAEEEPSGVAYLHFHENGRVFFSPLLPQDESRLPVRLAYSLESASVIRVRNIKGESDGWTNQYQLDGNELNLINPRESHHCKRVPPQEVPAWFQEAISKYC
jgi:hypothetical protein